MKEKILYYVLAFIAVIFRLEMKVIPDEQMEEELKRLEYRKVWQQAWKEVLEDNLNE